MSHGTKEGKLFLPSLFPPPQKFLPSSLRRKPHTPTRMHVTWGLTHLRSQPLSGHIFKLCVLQPCHGTCTASTPTNSWWLQCIPSPIAQVKVYSHFVRVPQGPVIPWWLGLHWCRAQPCNTAPRQAEAGLLVSSVLPRALGTTASTLLFRQCKWADHLEAIVYHLVTVNDGVVQGWETQLPVMFSDSDSPDPFLVYIQHRAP